MERSYSPDSTTFRRVAHAPERDIPAPSPHVVQEELRAGPFFPDPSSKTTADEAPSARVEGSGQPGDATLEDVEGAGEALVYHSDSITLDQKGDPCRLTKRMIATVVTIGGPGGWRTTTTYVKCLPRVRGVLARPRVVQPRRVRPCVRGRRHAGARRSANRSSSSAGSGDSDGAGGDGSPPPPSLESHRPFHLSVLLDLLQCSPGGVTTSDTGDLRAHRRLDDWIEPSDTARRRKRGRALDRRTETRARADSALTDGCCKTSPETAGLCPDDPEGR
jgi:hypothetical protein